MKLTILVENKEKENVYTEHGLSLYIEGDPKILFDTGASNAFLKNAQTLGIDLGLLDWVVLSHGHYDHGNGLEFFEFRKLLCHPDCFVETFQKSGVEPCGMRIQKRDIEKNSNIVTASEPYYITEDMIFLGEIPRRNNFESKKTAFMDAHGRDYFMPDDSALVTHIQHPHFQK